MKIKMLSQNIEIHPPAWFYFLFFITANLLMSCPALSTEEKSWVFLLGIFFPFLFFMVQSGPPAEKTAPVFSGESFPLPSAASLGLFLLLAVAMRCWVLMVTSAWPNLDESENGIFAWELSRHWNWKFFYGFGQSSPSLIWPTGILLKLSFSPLFSLWFPPVLFSTATIGMAYGAARQFFARSFSFLCAGLVAFSYLAVLIGNLGLNVVLVPFWECVLIYLLGRYRKSSPRHREKWLFLFGFCAGFGFSLCPYWPAAAAGFSLVLLGFIFKEDRKIPRLVIFAFSFGLGLSPFLWAAAREGYGGHLSSVSFWESSQPWWEPLQTLGSYFSAYSWGFPQASYVPEAMGYWNPLMDALLFLGLMEFYRLRNFPFVRGCFFLLILLMLPVALFTGLGPLRLVQVLPLWILITGFGIQSLVASLDLPKKLMAVAGILLLSGILDFGRLEWPYLDISRHPGRFLSTDKSLEEFRAYQILSDLNVSRGPVVVFSDCVPQLIDPSLSYVSAPFNMAWAPAQSLEKAKWIGALIPSHDAPSLMKDFPNGRVMALPSQVPGKFSHDFLVVLPVTPKTLPLFREWQKAYIPLWKATSQIWNLSDGKSWQPVLKGLLDAYPGLPKDPFIQSCFFEKLLFDYSWEKTFHPEDSWTAWNNFSGVFQRSFEQSYKDPVLRTKWGELLSMEHCPATGPRRP
jgi:hypothetical protein